MTPFGFAMKIGATTPCKKAGGRMAARQLWGPLNPGLKHASRMSIASPVTTPAEFYGAESSKIREEFETTGDGRASALQRCGLVDALIARLHAELSPSGLPGLSLVALGGYGRRQLFPQSDVDLLFLAPDEATRDARHEAVGVLTRTLWDLRLRLGSTVRALAECAELHRDNLEFSVSLLDCRLLVGDDQLFARLQNEAIPRLIARQHQD